MAGRKRQLFEVLGARQNAGRSSSGSEARSGRGAAGGGSGVDKVVGAGRSALAWFEKATGRSSASGSSNTRAVARTGQAGPTRAGTPPGMPGFAVVVVAFVLLGLGFGLGRWTAAPGEAPEEQQLRLSERGEGAGPESPQSQRRRVQEPRSPGWVPSYRRLEGQEYFARLEGAFYPVVTVPARGEWSQKARDIVEILRANGVESTRLHEMEDKNGRPVFAIGAYWPGESGELVGLVRGVDAGGDEELGRLLGGFSATVSYELGE